MDLTRCAGTLLACLALGLAACSPAAAPRPTSEAPEIHLALVAYSTPQEAYARLIPAFQLTPGGASVSVDPSFGSSGGATSVGVWLGSSEAGASSSEVGLGPMGVGVSSAGRGRGNGGDETARDSRR